MDVVITLLYYATIAGLAYVAVRIILSLWGGANNINLGFKNSFSSTNHTWATILMHECHFYQKLPPQSKAEFLKRIAYFYQNKNFVARGGMQINERMKVLICAAAAQITFGLPRLQLPHFKDILIYPSSYLNKRTGRTHMGEINTQGTMVFSWEHIEKGLSDPNDGYNLLLHELAHALRFEDYYPNAERHFLRQEDVNMLHHLFKKMEAPIRNRSITFLNKYASSNFEEFFAVSIESFFERPEEFKRQIPDLYHCLCRLLNQDPEILEKMNKKF